MTSHQPPTTTHEDDVMAAATIEPADLGETPVRRRLAPGPTPEESRLARSEEFRARIRGMLEQMPDHSEHEVPDTDDVAELRQRKYAAAWQASLAAADVADLADHTLEALYPDQHPVALGKFVESMTQPNPRVRTLVMAGATGPGKTTAAVAVGHAALAAGLLPRFVSHTLLTQWLRPEGLPRRGPYATYTANQLRALFTEADFLILDDLGQNSDPNQPVTEHVKTETMRLLDARINTPGRFTVVTTNHRSEVITDGRLTGGLNLMFGDQLLSRLSKRGAALAFTGPDRRGRITF